MTDSDEEYIESHSSTQSNLGKRSRSNSKTKEPERKSRKLSNSRGRQNIKCDHVLFTYYIINPKQEYIGRINKTCYYESLILDKINDKSLSLKDKPNTYKLIPGNYVALWKYGNHPFFIQAITNNRGNSQTWKIVCFPMPTIEEEIPPNPNPNFLPCPTETVSVNSNQVWHIFNLCDSNYKAVDFYNAKRDVFLNKRRNSVFSKKNKEIDNNTLISKFPEKSKSVINRIVSESRTPEFIPFHPEKNYMSNKSPNTTNHSKNTSPQKLSPKISDKIPSVLSDSNVKLHNITQAKKSQEFFKAIDDAIEEVRENSTLTNNLNNQHMGNVITNMLESYDSLIQKMEEREEKHQQRIIEEQEKWRSSIERIIQQNQQFMLQVFSKLNTNNSINPNTNNTNNSIINPNINSINNKDPNNKPNNEI